MIALALNMMHKRAVIVISNNLRSLYTRVLESLLIASLSSPSIKLPEIFASSSLNLIFSIKGDVI